MISLRYALCSMLLVAAACTPTSPPEEVPREEDLGLFGSGNDEWSPVDLLPEPDGDFTYVGKMPRLAAFIGRWEEYTAVERDSLAQFDLYSLRGSPTAVAELRRYNPDARLFYRVMPQTVAETNWERPWSWMDMVRRYVTENEWALLHDDGTEATMRTASYWRWLDFTEACPEGVFYDPFRPELDSRGLTVAEWLEQRFIPWFVTHEFDGYEGLWWEITAARPSPAWFHYDVPDPETGGRLDWNRNGVADVFEGNAVSFGAFAASWESVSAGWIARVRSRIGASIPIIGAGDGFAPTLDQLDGFKNEDFLNRNRWGANGWTWWDEFYSRAGATPRRGYVLQRDRARAGWSLSVNQIFWYDNSNWSFSNPLLRTRYVRFALGTTLLGDGYFSFYDNENGNAEGEPRNPWVDDLYRVKIGEYAYPFQRHVEDGDTLYVRYFANVLGTPVRALVVNPNDDWHLTVGPRDARIFEVR